MPLWWLALLAVQTPPFDMKNVPALMRQHCSAEWPDDFQMQDYCLNQQLQGMAQFKEASESVGRPLDRALERCVEEWTKAGVPDWQMIGHCSHQQAESYRKLHRPERG